MKKKLLIALLLAVILTIPLSGCRVAILSIGSNTANAFSNTHEKFKGNDTKKIKLQEGETCTLSFAIVTNDGSIDVSVTDADNLIYFEEDDVKTSSFSCELDQKGTYEISFKGDWHSGSYSVTWEIT